MDKDKPITQEQQHIDGDDQSPSQSRPTQNAIKCTAPNA